MHEGKIEINRELCKGCGYCIEACPMQVIVMTRQFNRAGYFTASPESIEKCSGCAVCANVCPDIAIDVFREDE